jgi:hypothetical protein
MLATLYAKLAALGLVLAALTGLYLWGHHEGATGVQARWDAAKAAQQAVADHQATASAQQTLTWTQQFSAIATHYEEAIHAPQPAVADAVGPAVAAGTLRLRDDAPAVCRGQVSIAAARSRAADAAATQALADRLANSIAAIRAGDEADQRERALGQQIIALQAVLQAERAQ